MITFDCPWCDGSARLADAAIGATDPATVRCDACGIEAELAPEPPAARDIPIAA
jgi:hypothetical protein